MALTRNFKETIANRAKSEPKFAHALLNEAATLFLNGEPETAKFILRDLVNSTVGFEKLATEIEKPNKSVHRMLSANGNPTMSSLSAIFAAIRKILNVEIHTEILSKIATDVPIGVKLVLSQKIKNTAKNCV